MLELHFKNCIVFVAEISLYLGHILYSIILLTGISPYYSIPPWLPKADILITNVGGDVSGKERMPRGLRIGERMERLAW